MTCHFYSLKIAAKGLALDPVYDVWVQPMVADLGGKGKGKQEITIDATQRDMRMDEDANYYSHTEGTKKFRQARKADMNLHF